MPRLSHAASECQRGLGLGSQWGCLAGVHMCRAAPRGCFSGQRGPRPTGRPHTCSGAPASRAPLSSRERRVIEKAEPGLAFRLGPRGPVPLRPNPLGGTSRNFTGLWKTHLKSERIIAEDGSNPPVHQWIDVYGPSTQGSITQPETGTKR